VSSIAVGRWLDTAGLVLVRQKPGSAKGVLFITIEDETGIANLVIWPSLYEKQRRIILSAGMIAVHGRVQREGEVVHLIARHLTDLSLALVARHSDYDWLILSQFRMGKSFGSTRIWMVRATPG
jgi:error-prone DNA polymerase